MNSARAAGRRAATNMTNSNGATTLGAGRAPLPPRGDVGVKVLAVICTFEPLVSYLD